MKWSRGCLQVEQCLSSQKDSWQRSQCGPVGVLASSDGTVLMCTALLTRLHPSTSYLFRVYAKNHKGVGPPSMASALVMTECTLPSPATDVAVWGVGADYAILGISPAPHIEDAPILEYRVELRSDSADLWMPADAQLDESDSACAHATVMRVKRLSPSTKYLFRVIAVNRKGFGLASNATAEVKTAGAPFSIRATRGTHATSVSSLPCSISCLHEHHRS
jgi:hypothetical protein